MKQILLGVMLAFLLVGSVGAVTTGFNFHKNVEVNGDWEWTTGSWSKTYPTTATYNYAVSSPKSTLSAFSNDDDIGTPWKWTGHTIVETNEETDYTSVFSVATVNDPDTTPATGGYTAFSFNERTVSTNPDSSSFVDITANGFGAAWITSHIHTSEGSWQEVAVTVN